MVSLRRVGGECFPPLSPPEDRFSGFPPGPPFQSKAGFSRMPLPTGRKRDNLPTASPPLAPVRARSAPPWTSSPAPRGQGSVFDGDGRLGPPIVSALRACLW